MADRTPLHPYALTLDDVRPGVEFIKFHRGFGIVARGTFVGEPYKEPLGSITTMFVTVRLTEEHGARVSRLKSISISDMGIAPYDGVSWNGVNFTIPAGLEHTLPSTDLAIAAMAIANAEEFLEEVEEE